MRSFCLAGLLAVSALTFTTAAHAADCQLSVTAPAIPDGKTVDKDAMAKAQAEVKSFVAAGQEYLSCLEIDLKKGGRGADKYNEASSMIEKVASQYNAALKDFKARAL